MTVKRDNAYWAGRLAKDGHVELLDKVRTGAITMFAARTTAGYRKAQPVTPAAKLSYHWRRASAEERLRFVGVHPLEIDRVLKELVKLRKALKEQKAVEEAGK